MNCPKCSYPNPQGVTYCQMCYEVFNRSAADRYLHAQKRARMLEGHPASPPPRAKPEPDAIPETRILREPLPKIEWTKLVQQWSGKLTLEGLSIIEQIGNGIVRLEIEKDNISSNRATMVVEKVKSDDCVSLLKMIIHMKVKEFVEAKILSKGDEPLVEWL